MVAKPGSDLDPADLPAPKQAKGRRGVLVIALLGALIPMGVMFFVIGGGGGGSVEGQIVSSGSPYGDYMMQPSSCFSGEHESFFGVWVTPELEKVDGRQGFRGGLKLVKSHLGEWEVYVESPIECSGLKCKIRQLPRDACSLFDVSVENTNTTFNDIRVRRGHASLDCRFSSGGKLSANLLFKGCH